MTTLSVNARYVVVDGTAEPGTMDLGDGESNTVSAIRFRTVSGGMDGLVIEGRPEDVLATLRSALAVAEENLMQTVRSPELRRMYGGMADFDTCERAGQHVRSTRHTRWDCPNVTEVDIDHAPE